MLTLYAVCTLVGLAAGAAPSGLVAIQVEAPHDLAGTFAGRIAAASAPLPEGSLVGFAPMDDRSGCEAYTVRPEQAMAIVSVGNCSMADKAARAQEAGMKGILLVSDFDGVNLTMLNEVTSPEERFEVFVIGVPKGRGEDIVNWSVAHSYQPVSASVSIYNAPFPLLDPSVLVLVALAVSLIALGSWFGTSDLRLGSPLAPTREDQVLEIEWWVPAFWVLGASVALVILYFTMQWIIYIVLFLFAMGGVTTMTEIGQACLRYRWPITLQKKVCTLPLIGKIEFATLIALTLGVANSTAWWFLRKTHHAWPFQNLVGISFLCFFQRSIRLPNIKLAALLLTLMFVFDIFWVFVSPLFFSNSVMVEVAMGGGSGEMAPMLLRIPAFGDPLGADRMLGYGDIAIPGLCVSFLRRHDILSYRGWRAGYFVPAVVGYAVGLCSALVGLYFMQMGQPALLYLVPGVLGTTMVLAGTRGECKHLWEGTPCANPDIVRTMLACKYCPGGHLLQRAPAPAGTCDGCRQRVAEGTMVMDCRLCDWYLCPACHPQDEEKAEEKGAASTAS